MLEEISCGRMLNEFMLSFCNLQVEYSQDSIEVAYSAVELPLTTLKNRLMATRKVEHSLCFRMHIV